MSDPIPSASGDPDSVEQSHPANAEDRKAAAALDSLHTNELAADGPAKGPSSAEQEALGKAMSRLEIAAGKGSAKTNNTETQKKEAEVKRKAVKISASDVIFLAEQLDLHKNKATDLLKAHEGNVTLALKAFITPSWKA
ncbi:hypothetical protein N7523_010883 [Penicillium sp. IBT 18751x]|nr:hypothetical protein N7523_010883 [Penicillium sp. IBT 18751x]